MTYVEIILLRLARRSRICRDTVVVPVRVYAGVVLSSRALHTVVDPRILHSHQLIDDDSRNKLLVKLYAWSI